MPKEEIKEIPVPVIAGLDGVYFPSFPYPDDGVIIPLDKEQKIVTDTETEVITVVIPYWYWKMVIDHVKETESAVTALYAARHPP